MSFEGGLSSHCSLDCFPVIRLRSLGAIDSEDDTMKRKGVELLSSVCSLGSVEDQSQTYESPHESLHMCCNQSFLPSSNQGGEPWMKVTTMLIRTKWSTFTATMMMRTGIFRLHSHSREKILITALISQWNVELFGVLIYWSRQHVPWCRRFEWRGQVLSRHMDKVRQDSFRHKNKLDPCYLTSTRSFYFTRWYYVLLCWRNETSITQHRVTTPHVRWESI